MFKFKFSRGWNIAFWASVAVVLLFSAAVATTRIPIEHQTAYGVAVLDAAQHESGLGSLQPISPTDPAFDLQSGLVVAAERPARCEQATAALDAFRSRWLDASSYDGHRIPSHFMAAVLALKLEALATRNGCAPLASFEQFVARIHAIRDNDLEVHALSDLPVWIPMPVFYNGGIHLFTIRGLNAVQWGALLDERSMRSWRCTADAHCDPTKQDATRG